MGYATAQQAINDGTIIYGRGNVKAVRSGNGFIYWPTKAGVALDAAPDSTHNDDAAIALKIARATAKVKAEMDANRKADRVVRRLFPFLMDMAAEDDIEAEKAVLSEGEQGEAEDGEDDFTTKLIADSKAEAQRQRQAVNRNLAFSRKQYANANYEHSRRTLSR